jgi:hypothetical protein
MQVNGVPFPIPNFFHPAAVRNGMGKMSQMAAGQYGRNNLGNYLKKLGQVELDEGQIA